MQKCNLISMNTTTVIDAIRQHYIVAMEKAEDELIRIMQTEIFKGSGRKTWQKEIALLLKETYREIANDAIEMHVGQDSSQQSNSLNLYVRAMVIAYGNQASGKLTSKPGQIVWDDNINGQHMSRAKSVFDLPSGFNQSGYPFVENAVKLMKKHFSDILKDASRSLPSSVFFGNVTSVAR